jgi:hypothetical protein
MLWFCVPQFLCSGGSIFQYNSMLGRTAHEQNRAKNFCRKLIVGILLCSGVFIMLATLLRCVLSLKDVAGINNSTIWAIRETVRTTPHGNYADRSIGVLMWNCLVCWYNCGQRPLYQIPVRYTHYKHLDPYKEISYTAQYEPIFSNTSS